MLYSAANTYKNNAVQTASPAELTLMLYDGALKFCNIAMLGLEKNDIEKVNINIQKAQNIISELRITLDFKYEVAKDFELIYDYIYRRLVEANIKKDAEILEDTIGHIRDLRDMWKEIMKVTKIKVG